MIFTRTAKKNHMRNVNIIFFSTRKPFFFFFEIDLSSTYRSIIDFVSYCHHRRFIGETYYYSVSPPRVNPLSVPRTTRAIHQTVKSVVSDYGRNRCWGGKCYFIYCERIFEKLVFQSAALSIYLLYLPAVRVRFWNEFVRVFRKSVASKDRNNTCPN